MEKENLSNIWPILYFEADWPAKSYKFDFDIHLIKANNDILAILKKPESFDHGEAIHNFSGYTEWFLALPSPKPTEHVSSNKIGISFEDQLQQAIVDSFLLCLKLIRQTAAICPLEVRNVEFEGSSVDPDSFENALDDYFGINTDKPPVFKPESFHLGDLQFLTDLWSAIIKLRNLDRWSTWIYDEVFWADCDKQAGQGAVKKIVDAIMSSPSYLELSEEELKQHRKHWTASINEALDKGDQFFHDLYKDSLEKVLSAYRDLKTFNPLTIKTYTNHPSTKKTVYHIGIHNKNLALKIEAFANTRASYVLHKPVQKISYLNGLYDSEGGVDFNLYNGRMKHTIRFDSYNLKLINDVKKMLSDFDINVNVSAANKLKGGYRLNIVKKQDVVRFDNTFFFSIDRKQKKLKEMVIYCKKFHKKGKTLPVKESKIVEKFLQYNSVNKVSKSLGICKQAVVRVLVEQLSYKGYIDNIKLKTSIKDKKCRCKKCHEEFGSILEGRYHIKCKHNGGFLSKKTRKMLELVDI